MPATCSIWRVVVVIKREIVNVRVFQEFHYLAQRMLMPQDTADLVGTKGANFTFSIDAGMIPQNGGALLIVGGQADQKLVVAASGREVTVPNLPSGDSTISLALVWAPGETNDATIDVGTVTTGTVTAPVPKHTIDNGDSPGFVELFGK